MFDFYPHTYTFIYFHLLLIVVLVTSLRLLSGNYINASKSVAFLFALGITLFIGLRPYHIVGAGKYFGDTGNYYRTFSVIAEGNSNIDFKDFGFGLFTKFFAENLNAGLFFFILALLYVWPVYLASKRLTSNNSYLLLLVIVSSFLFWANGVNGIRIGIASSWFLLALTYPNKKWAQVVIFALAVTFHKSILLPIFAYVVTLFYSNSKGYIFAWFSSIVLSIMFAGFWETFFVGFDLGDERFSQYLTTEADASVFAYTGFRWDFLFYSAIPVALGAHYILKKRYTNKLYIQLFNTYLVANSFWILVIRASFSNRFASLSWFLIPIIIFFPLLKRRIWTQQEAKIGLMLFLSFAFTYFMSFDSIWG